MRSLTLFSLAVACLGFTACTGMNHKRVGQLGALGGRGVMVDKKEGVLLAWDNEKSFQDFTSLGKTLAWTDLGGDLLGAAGNVAGKYLSKEATKAAAAEATKRTALTEATKRAALQESTKQAALVTP